MTRFDKSKCPNMSAEIAVVRAVTPTLHKYLG